MSRLRSPISISWKTTISLALLIDKSILDQIGADADTQFEISTDGKALILKAE